MHEMVIHFLIIKTDLGITYIGITNILKIQIKYLLITFVIDKVENSFIQLQL